MTAYTKTIQLSDGTNTVVVGGTQVKYDWNNELGSFAEPQVSGGGTNRQVLNLNRVKKMYEVQGKINDEVATKLDSKADKEASKSTFETIAESQSNLTLTYGSDTYSGYIEKFTVTERAQEDGSVYNVQFSFMVGTSMRA